MTNSFTMTGNATAYGATSGSETFSLSGYDNTVLLDGAADTLAITGGQYDSVDLNASGFTTATTDSIDLGASVFNTVSSSHDLYGATIAITGASGPNSIAFTNHGGTSSVMLGYEGSAAQQHGTVIPNSVTLNGDATNTIGYQGSGGAAVTVGQAGDGLSGYTTSVALSGLFNTVSGGDETFTVTSAAGGGYSSVVLGNANNMVSLAGAHNKISLGTGNNVIVAGSGQDFVHLASGSAGAGTTDQIALQGAGNAVLAGDENVTITGARASLGVMTLGNGNNVVNVGGGGGHAIFGRSLDNTSTNIINIGRGGSGLTFNGGVDQVDTGSSITRAGSDTVTLNGTMLGTSLDAHGAFNKVILTQDANAAITDDATNGAMRVTIDADASGGMGNITITGFANDDLAHIHLVGASPYTITPDNTSAGGVTFHFSQGSIDLVGLQSVPNNLFV